MPLDQAEGIVCTGLFDDRARDARGLPRRAGRRRAKRGLKLLCANPDIVVDLGETRVCCAGALAQLYEEMGGETL